MLFHLHLYMCVGVEESEVGVQVPPLSEEHPTPRGDVQVCDNEQETGGCRLLHGLNTEIIKI